MSLFFITSCNNAQNKQETKDVITDTTKVSTNMIPPDTYSTNKGDLKITLVGHASLIFEFDNKIIHVDPYSKVADYSKLPAADLIMLTHEHGDHLDTTAINQIKKNDTHFIVSKVCNEILGLGEIMENGSKSTFNGIDIEAVPAYNMVNKKDNGEFYHPKGRGNGYVFTFGDKKVYVAGDTENIPEMKELESTIDIAFLPKNLPYTMTDEMFVDAVKMLKPKMLYPYHFSEYDNDKISKELANETVEIKLRPMSNN